MSAYIHVDAKGLTESWGDNRSYPGPILKMSMDFHPSDADAALSELDETYKRVRDGIERYSK